MNKPTLKRTVYLLFVLFVLSALLLACRSREEQPATTAPTTTAPATTDTTTDTTTGTTVDPAQAPEAETAETAVGGPVTQQAQQTGPSAAPSQPATTPTEEGGPQPLDPATTPTAPEEIAAAPTDPATPDTEPATEPAAEPATDPAAAPADTQAGAVTVTLDNVGATAWSVAAVEGDDAVAETATENPTLNLTVGTRYTFINQGSPTHPLDFRDAEGNFLLAQSGQGNFEADAEVAWQDDTGSVSFTLTPELAEALSSYHCSVHANMQGAISITP